MAEETPVTIDTALRLARLLDTTPEFWMTMQTGGAIDRQTADKKAEIAAIPALPVVCVQEEPR